MIVVNFKRYPEADGERAVALAAICKKLTEEFMLPIIPAPQEKDMHACIAVGIDCWSQKYMAQNGHRGTLLNHSDYRLSTEQLKEELYLARGRGEKVCICTSSLEETRELVALSPDYILYEPPELIGSLETSVAKSKPEVIEQAAIVCRQEGVPLLVGAGVKTKSDVEVSLRLGAIGIGVASAIVKAENKEQKLRELAQAFKINS